MRNISLPLLTLLPAASFAAPQQPNVVVVFVDQLAPWALSCYGAQEIRTPHIDQLAQEGTLFENAFCVKAVSTPSRGCMLTGLYPFAHKAVNNQQLLDDGIETYADVLNRAGYETGYIGKWHLAGHMSKYPDGTENPNWNPAIHCHFKDAAYMWNNGHWKNIVTVKNGDPKVSNKISDNSDEYGTDWVFQRGFEYITHNRRNPFCLVLSPPDPHPGFKVRAPYDKRFKTSDMKIPTSFYQDSLTNMSQKMWPEAQYSETKSLRANKSQYLGMVACLDDYIGKLEAHLKKEGIWENTIVILTSDHGEMMGSFAHRGKVIPFNDSYQIPFIVKPATSVKMKKVTDLYSNLDFKATLAGMLHLPEQEKGHGCDLSGLLQGKTQTPNQMVFLDFMEGQPNTTHVGVVTPDYWFACIFETANKKNVRARQVLLFDRHKDPKQLHNLHATGNYLPIEQKLLTQIKAEFRRVNHPNQADLDLIDILLKDKE